MHSSGSCLLTILERARAVVEDPTADTQYDDDFLIRQVLPAEYTNVMNAIQLGEENPIILRMDIDLEADTEYYQLPPCIRQIWRLGKMTETGTLTHDWFPRNDLSPLGMGWSIQGNTLGFRPIPQNDETWVLWYIPSADFCCHKGTGTVTGPDSITLDTTPSLGLYDKRPNAYTGAVIRIVDADLVWDERIIASHDISTDEATVRVPFSDGWPANGTEVDYEIAPIGWQALWNCLALRVAYNIGVMRNLSEKKLGIIDGQFRWALKAARDQLGNLQGRTTKGFQNQTYDNTQFSREPKW